jgi:hypothetical protein
MNKLILEEIDRIRQVMGLITEGSRFPWLVDVIGYGTGRARTGGRDLINNLSQRLTDAPKMGANKLKTLVDDIESYNVIEINVGEEDAILFRESIQKLADNKNISYREALEKVVKEQFSEEDILESLAIAKARRIAKVGLKPSSFDNFLEQRTYLNRMLVDQTQKTIDTLRKMEGQSGAEATLNEILRREDLIKTGGFSPEVQRYWFDLYYQIKSGLYDVLRPVDNPELDSQIREINLDDAEMNRLRNGESSIQVPEGPIKDFATLKFKRFKKLSPEQQKDLVDQAAAETLAAFNKTIDKYRSQGAALEDAQKVFSNPKLGPAEKMKILRNAINKAQPSLGVGQDAVDWLVNYLVGYNMKNEEWLWTNGGWKKVLYSWFLINAGFAVVEFITRGFLTKGEDPDNYGSDDIERFMNRFDIVGLLLRVIPVPGLARLILSEGVQGVIESGGFRPPSSEEVLKKFPGASKKDINEHPKYQENASLLEPRLDDSVWIVRGNEDLGIWYWNLDTDKMENVLPGSSSSSSTQTTTTPTTTTYEENFNDFKKFLKDSGLSDSDAVNDTSESGYFIANGKDYVYDDSAKTFKVE